MDGWYQSDESDIPMWVLDLDDAVFSVDHRRLCVWQDAFEGAWLWEIQTWHGSGMSANGSAASRAEAMTAAEIAARIATGAGGLA